MSTLVHPGVNAPLTFKMPDGDTSKFPRSRIFAFPGGAEDSNSPVDLSHVADGLYLGSWLVPISGGFFLVSTIVYDDAGHTVLTVGVDQEHELLVVDHQGARVQLGGTLDRSASPAVFRVNAWLEKAGQQVGANLDDAVLNLYDKDGVDLLGGTPISVATPDAQGVFLFEFDDPGFAIGQSQAYFHVQLEENDVVYTGVASISFLRRA